MSRGLHYKHRIRSRVGVGSAWFSADMEVKQVKNRIRGRGRVIGHRSGVTGQGHTQVQSAGAEAGEESNQDQGQESKVRVRIRDRC